MIRARFVGPPGRYPSQPQQPQEAAEHYERKQGWQQSGTLTTGRDKRVSMQADFGPAACYFTVQFGVVPPKAAIPAYDAVAEITWSVEGATIRREVSVANGVSVSAPGQAVRVVVRDRTLQTALIGNNDYTVDITVTPGARPATQQPPTLQAIWPYGGYVLSLAPAALTTIPIPQDAGVISAEILISADFAAAFPLRALVSEQVPGTQIQKAYAITDAPTGFIPVAAGATELQLYNKSADPISCTVTWGIDG